MPLIDSSYSPPFGFSNGFVQTIFPTLFRRLRDDFLVRERIPTPDQDFLDLDWSRMGSETLVIVSHGLTGSSRGHYVLGTVLEANRHGWDALAWNYRGCSGEVNTQLRLYHSGATDDLDVVVQHALAQGYTRIHLVGFSMGGNLSLLYAGRSANSLPSEIESVSAFSVPCNLEACAYELAKPSNRIFMSRFLKELGENLKAKASQYPTHVDLNGFAKIRTFAEYDERYTAPIHGFRSAVDYWNKSSCLSYLADIRIPALMVNAQNDPFLPEQCYPRAIARSHANFYFEEPTSGGHVGFIQRNPDRVYWMEGRAMAFIREQGGHLPTPVRLAEESV